MLWLLRDAGGRPLSTAAMRDAGVRRPATVIYELGLRGHLTGRAGPGPGGELEQSLTVGIDEPTCDPLGGDHPQSYGLPLGHSAIESFLRVPVRIGGECPAMCIWPTRT